MKTEPWGTWVAKSVRCPALDFDQGHDLRVVEWIPASGFILRGESV